MTYLTNDAWALRREAPPSQARWPGQFVSNGSRPPGAPMVLLNEAPPPELPALQRTTLRRLVLPNGKTLVFPTDQGYKDPRGPGLPGEHLAGLGAVVLVRGRRFRPPGLAAGFAPGTLPGMSGGLSGDPIEDIFTELQGDLKKVAIEQAAINTSLSIAINFLPIVGQIMGPIVSMVQSLIGSEYQRQAAVAMADFQNELKLYQSQWETRISAAMDKAFKEETPAAIKLALSGDPLGGWGLGGMPWRPRAARGLGSLGSEAEAQNYYRMAAACRINPFLAWQAPFLQTKGDVMRAIDRTEGATYKTINGGNLIDITNAWNLSIGTGDWGLIGRVLNAAQKGFVTASVAAQLAPSPAMAALVQKWQLTLIGAFNILAGDDSSRWSSMRNQVTNVLSQVQQAAQAVASAASAAAQQAVVASADALKTAAAHAIINPVRQIAEVTKPVAEMMASVDAEIQRVGERIGVPQALIEAVQVVAQAAPAALTGGTSLAASSVQSFVSSIPLVGQAGSTLITPAVQTLSSPVAMMVLTQPTINNQLQIAAERTDQVMDTITGYEMLKRTEAAIAEARVKAAQMLDAEGNKTLININSITYRQALVKAIAARIRSDPSILNMILQRIKLQGAANAAITNAGNAAVAEGSKLSMLPLLGAAAAALAIFGFAGK